MKKNFKLKILSGILAGSLCIGSFPAAFALENDGTIPDQNTGNSANNTVLSAFVPTELPIKMNTSGDITVPTNAAIVNGMENRNIRVSNVKVNMEEGWKGVPYSDDVYLQANDTQVMALQFRGDAMQEDGSFSLTPEKWQIGANQSLPLEMQAKIPKQTKTGDRGKIATVEYTLELDDANQIDVDWDNGLMLPGSKNVAVFEWATTDKNNTLQSVVSDNPDIQLTPVTDAGAASPPTISRAATGEQNVSAQAADLNYTGERAYVITAKKRGTALVTGQLITGETASFIVNVSELPEGANGTQDAPIEGSATVAPTVQPGSSLKADDLNITIPVVQPDGTTASVPITPDVLPDTPLTEGDNEITITTDVNGITIHIVIHIVIETRPSVSASPVSITVSKAPDKTNYHPGENFDQTGMEVTVTYDDGSTKTLTGGYIVTDGANLPDGKDSVNVTYTENGKTVSTTQPITTAPDSSEPDDSKTPVSIAVTPDSYKKDYTEGEDFDPEGMTVEVTYADGHKEIKDSGFTITDGDALPLDKPDVNVVYTEGELSASCKAPITVSPATDVEPESIAVTTPPYTTEYVKGTDFDKSGMKITVTYSDGSTAVKSSGFEITDGEALPIGKTNVTVSYTESGKTMTTTTPITVKENDLIDYMANVSYPYHALLVSTSNTSGYFFSNMGSKNREHLVSDANNELYLTAKGFHVAAGRVIRVKPGTYDLACSIGLVTKADAADISIDTPDSKWGLTTLRGTGRASLGSVYYTSSGGTGYKGLHLADIQDGDVIKIYIPYGETASNVTKRFNPYFYIICGEYNLPDDIVLGRD